MFAQQERFADMRDFVRAVEEFGYDAVEASHSTPPDKFERLLEVVPSSALTISSIHAPAPLVEVDGRRNSSFNLAALDAEREHAVEFTKSSIDRAANVGAAFVVVHLGGIGSKMLDSEFKQRKLYDSGTREGPEVDALRRETLERRAEVAPPYYAQARDSLAELAAYAKERGVAIGLENRLHHHEFPLPHEAAELCADYPPDAVGYWHDTGHAEVQARLGYVDKRVWLETNRDRTIGTHLSDVDGLGDHRAPGRGDVEWDYIADGLPAEALRVFEINQHQSDEEVAGAIAYLRERGVVG